MKLVRSTIVVAAAAAAALALAPAAAEANTFRGTDAPNDVMAFISGADTATPQPDRANGDVVASLVKHKRTKVIARMTYRELEGTEAFNGHLFAMKSNKVRRDVAVVTASGVAPQVVMTKPNGKRVSCKVKRSVDYTANTVTVKVPRSCLGNPRWVKVGMASVFMTGLGSTDTQYVDDALRSGSLGSSPTFSPKVRR